MVDVNGRYLLAMSIPTVLSYVISEQVQRAVDPAIPRISDITITTAKALHDHAVETILKEVPLSPEQSLLMGVGNIFQALGCTLIGIKAGSMYIEGEGSNLWEEGKKYLQSHFSLALDDRYMALVEVISVMAGIALKYYANEGVRTHLSRPHVKEEIVQRQVQLIKSDPAKWT